MKMGLTEAAGAVLFEPINQGTAAANEIVAAVAERKIRILGIVLSNNDATNPVVATLQDDADLPKKILGPIRLAAGQTVVIPASGLGYGETNIGEALNLLLGSAITVGGSITYQLVR